MEMVPRETTMGEKMRRAVVKGLLIGTFGIVGSVLVAMPAVHANEKKRATVAKADNPGRLEKRIDFGNSYILGQSIKSGAVYLLHRKKSDIKSMLKYREDYREELMEVFNITKLKKIQVSDQSNGEQATSQKQ
jgi:hypothetical protein